MEITGIDTYGSFLPKPVQASQGLPGNLEEMTQKLIQDKDKDGNGTLNALEICISDEAFQKADANSDGELDNKELMANAREIGKKLGPPPGMPPFRSKDDDDDDDDEDSTQIQTLLDLLQKTNEDITTSNLSEIL